MKKLILAIGILTVLASPAAASTILWGRLTSAYASAYVWHQGLTDREYRELPGVLPMVADASLGNAGSAHAECGTNHMLGTAQEISGASASSTFGFARYFKVEGSGPTVITADVLSSGEAYARTILYQEDQQAGHELFDWQGGSGQWSMSADLEPGYYLLGTYGIVGHDASLSVQFDAPADVQPIPEPATLALLGLSVLVLLPQMMRRKRNSVV